MKMWIADNWKDYEVIDTSTGEKQIKAGINITVTILEVTKVGGSGSSLTFLNSGL